MTKRIFSSTVAVAIFTIALCFVLFFGALYTHFDSRITEELAAQTEYVAQGVENNGEDYLKSLSNTSSRITWVDTDGTVLYDSTVDAATLENHADRAEISQAMTNSTGTSTRYSSTLSERTVYYAKRLADGTVIRLSDAQASVWALTVGMLPPIFAIILIALLIAALMSYRVSTLIVKPLGELDLNNPEDADTYDELAPFLRRISDQNEKIDAQMLELQRQQKEFSDITSNMSEGFLVLDAEEKVLSHNSAALKLLGADEKAEDGCAAFVLNRSEAFRTAVEQAMLGNGTTQTMNLGEMYIRILANPVRDGGAIIVLMDVTESEQRETLRREFAANVSHELKTPLTSISGIAEIMKIGLVKQEDYAHFAGKIYDEAHRLITLVGDIIKVSRLDGQNDMEREAVDMKGIVESTAKSLEEIAKEKNVAIGIDCDSCAVVGMRSVLEEIVYNIAENAVKYNVSGGRVDIKLKAVDGHTVLTVADTGIGIPKDAQSRVFERFYRVDKSHSKEIGGTGLGLSIVKHGAEAHGAKLDLKSAEGKGTTITVTF